MAVRIRMKQMGRTAERVGLSVAIDGRQPRDGKVIEELGVYDPHVADKDARVKLKPSRIKYWQSVGAKASEHCAAIFAKYMKKWEAAEAQEAARAAEEAARAKEAAPTA